MHANAKSYSAIPGESRLTYVIRHPLHKVEGVSKDFRCTVDVGDDTAKASIQVKAPVAAFNSGNSNRDAHALETLEAMKYPFVEFSSDSVRREDKVFRVFGQLTLHGIRRPLQFLVSPEIDGDRIRVKGGFTVNLTDFAMKRPTLLFMPVADDLHIDIDVLAKGP